MPIFTPDGKHVLMGQSRLSVDGKPVAGSMVAGNPHPLGNATFIAQALWQGDYRLLTFNLAGTMLSVVSAEGQNHLVAGRNVWARRLDGGTQPGYRDSWEHWHPGWHPMAVDDATGLVAVCTNYFAGEGLGVWDGESLNEIETAPGVPLPLGSLEACFRGGLLTYRNAAGKLATWTQDGSPGPTVADVPVTGVRFSGTWRLSYKAGVGLVVHHWADTVGIVVSGREDDYNADVFDRGENKVTVVSSATAGEAPSDLRTYEINQYDPANRFVKLIDDPIEPEEPPVEYGLWIEHAAIDQPDGSVTVIENKWLEVGMTPVGDPSQDESWPIRYSATWTEDTPVEQVKVADEEYVIRWPRAKRDLSSNLSGALETRASKDSPGGWERFGVLKFIDNPNKRLVYRVETIHRDPEPHRVRSIAITLRAKP